MQRLSNGVKEDEALLRIGFIGLGIMGKPMAGHLTKIENKDQRYAVKNDAANECIEKMIEADGIILGSPTYFTDVTAEMKALIDRAGFVSRANGGMFKNKLGAAVVAVRRAGAIHTLDTMNHFFWGSQMIVPGQGLAVGRDKGEVEKDEEGMQAVKALGQRMTWLLKKLYG